MAESPLVMRGTVTRLEAGKPHVEVPDLGVGYSFGPCQTATGGPLVKGDRVLVVSVGGVREDVVVIAQLDPAQAQTAGSASTGSVAAAASVSVTVPLDKPMPNATYRVAASLTHSDTGEGLTVVRILSRTTTTVTVLVRNTAALAAKTGAVDVIAFSG